METCAPGFFRRSRVEGRRLGRPGIRPAFFQESRYPEITFRGHKSDNASLDDEFQNANARRSRKRAARLQKAKRAMAGRVADGGVVGLRIVAKQTEAQRMLDLRVYARNVRRRRARREGAGDEGLKNKKENKGVSEKAPTASSLEFAPIQHGAFIFDYEFVCQLCQVAAGERRQPSGRRSNSGILADSWRRVWAILETL